MASEEESNAYEATMGTGIRATLVELGRVVWPSREELFRMTGVVIGFLIIIATFIAVVDAGLGRFQNVIYGSK
ncbi:MAG: SecE/Sec61-gamma subunit of protein translocation complex [Chloroflexota bacterium]|jgi:preprotein translocase SecE subunit|nr:SecE/Sec61-gamma subunit of protein translocation complex [Chloroflexota bacterium]